MKPIFEKSLKFLEILLILSVLQILCPFCEAFNFAKQPNLIFRIPKPLRPLKIKERSSYFGYSLIVRDKSILIGAPRAQSILKSQREINEPGAIYKCSFQKQTCAPFIFERKSNLHIENRDNQFLGAVMNGGTKDSDKLFFCAPKFTTPDDEDDSDYLHGICYLTKNTLGDTTVNLKKLNTLELYDNQKMYGVGEEGFSVHMPANRNEFIMGAPGVWVNIGAVVHYKMSNEDSNYLGNTFIPEVNWGINVFAYFGYAVASGYFDSKEPKRLLYVTSAPRNEEAVGVVHIYEITNDDRLKNIKKLKGQQYGEYFGYAILVEDLNGDGLSDLIISAPQYSFINSNDNGAIYVFINRGNFNFKRIQITSPIKKMARFGTTLTSLGDINQDGFNDIAVGAPFAGNGSVFIYLGDKNGIRRQPSQRLNSPQNIKTIYGAHMFGHGLCKAADIDTNDFNGLAIGAPNAEMVFLYHTYPIVKIFATIKLKTYKISIEQKNFSVSFCYRIETTSKPMLQHDLNITAIVDAQMQRVTFLKTKTNEYFFVGNATTMEQCENVECSLEYSEKFKPIELEMHYKVAKPVPDSTDFCSDCVAVDPKDANMTSRNIILSTGCTSQICIADLKLKSSGFSSNFILGTSKMFKIKYEISNNGENAYLPQLNVTTSNLVNFAQIPPNCKITEEYTMLCNLNVGQPMKKNMKAIIDINFDLSRISTLDTSINISAEVLSVGNESKDNKIIDIIKLQRYAEIHITGPQDNAPINIKENVESILIENIYEIENIGPSTINEFELIMHIPVAYKNASDNFVQIIEVSDVKIHAAHKENIINIQVLDDAHNITETNIQDNETYSNSIQPSLNMEKTQREELIDVMKGKLPLNRTILFNCNNNPDMVKCVHGILKIPVFEPRKSIILHLNYTIKQQAVEEILMKPLEFFVTFIDLKFAKPHNFDNNSFKVVNTIEPVIIQKKHDHSTPLWIIIVSAIVGLLLLAAITFGIKKLGFFKRSRIETLQEFKTESQDELNNYDEIEEINEEIRLSQLSNMLEVKFSE